MQRKKKIPQKILVFISTFLVFLASAILYYHYSISGYYIFVSLIGINLIISCISVRNSTKQEIIQSTQKNKISFRVIGLMSGTSLDGLDIIFCEITQIQIKKSNFHYQYSIIAAKTYPYPPQISHTLRTIHQQSAYQFCKFDRLYGSFLGLQVNKFIDEFQIKNIDFVASHGHTIFHAPTEDRVTVQIGHGAYIASEVQLPVVSDFRSLDVALMGEGAPLVPIGDELLFEDYDFCLNLGGIANISCKEMKTNQQHDSFQFRTKMAFDICPCNIILNFLAEFTYRDYDKDGELAKNGKINENLLASFKKLDFFSRSPPKSLGREWIEMHMMPLLNKNEITIEDRLATSVELIAFEVAKVVLSFLDSYKNYYQNIDKSQINSQCKMLVTGGGAYNKFLIERMQYYIPSKICEIIVPDNLIVEYKEALIFALLGSLRWIKKNNCFRNITGARENNCGGCIYYHTSSLCDSQKQQ